MSSRPEDPDKLSMQEYRHAFGKPSPLEKALNSDSENESTETQHQKAEPKDKEQSPKEKKKQITESFKNMDKESQQILLDMIGKQSKEDNK